MSQSQAALKYLSMSSMGQLTFAVTSTVAILIILGSLHTRRFNSKENRILPPGPRGIPLLGNLLQVPRKHLATYFRGLLEQYGGLVSLNLAGSTVILLGDKKVAKALLGNHSAKNSSRPSLPYFHKHVDPTGDFWALASEARSIGRKLTNEIMSVVQAGKTELLQEFEAVLNVQHLLDDGGKNWFRHIERLGSSVTLTAAFGLHCPTGYEPELGELLSILTEMSNVLVPTASITNFLPFLDLIPGPMPWRLRARSIRERNDALYEKLIDHAMNRNASGMDTWAGTFVCGPEGDQRRLIKQFAAPLKRSSLQTFVLACIRYPEWIAAAQKEIDNVVGLDRLPTFKDRPFLPYIEAVVRETLRWRPAVGFGVPHCSTAEDTIEHNGQKYLIPKGSLIFAVTLAIEHDQSNFEDHDRFMPERFLDLEGKLKAGYETSAFGFGRRVCPGVPFAERSLWIVIVTMLWTFNIRASDEIDPKTGQPFQYDDSDAAFHGDFGNSPIEFPAIFEPRSLQRAEVARREWVEYEKNLSVLMPGTA